MALETRILKQEYPCCKGQARFTRIEALPRQRYTKRCPRCGRVWDVKVTLLMRQGNDIIVEESVWEG